MKTVAKENQSKPDIRSKQTVYHHPFPFELESGEVLPELRIAYTTHGTLNPTQDNVIWVAHALTANADPTQWWSGLVGAGDLLDPNDYFIVCANVIGSCYGSTGPAHFDPLTGDRYLQDFPAVTIHDMVKAHQLLQRHLGIRNIYLGLGGSMGGQQLLEWAVTDTTLFEHLALVATGAKSSPWGIAFRTAQRMALEADPSFFSTSSEGGKKGMEAARAIGMLSYRSPECYNATQSEETERVDNFRAESYQRYQGLKLSKRFDARSYHLLSKSMDSHDVGRGRGGTVAGLNSIRAKALVIGIRNDLLFSLDDQYFLSNHLKNNELHIIDSLYGHDGFLIETSKISQLLKDFLRK